MNCPKCHLPMHRFHDCHLNPVANPTAEPRTEEKNTMELLKEIKAEVRDSVDNMDTEGMTDDDIATKICGNPSPELASLLHDYSMKWLMDEVTDACRKTQ